jgi:hypothetical protein
MIAITIPLLLLLLGAPSLSAYSAASSRRVVFSKLASAGGFAFVAVSSSSPAQALEACPAGTQNCIRTSWTPPENASASDIVNSIRAVLQEYPTEGQGGIDNKGFEIVQDSLAESGVARVEYKNYGNFAKFLNGGKPFVDDLVIELKGSDGKVQVKSSSRIGESDLGVNQKRLQYLGKALQAKGWSISDPKY